MRRSCTHLNKNTNAQMFALLGRAFELIANNKYIIKKSARRAPRVVRRRAPAVSPARRSPRAAARAVRRPRAHVNKKQKTQMFARSGLA
jgi:hypothetical protein